MYHFIRHLSNAFRERKHRRLRGSGPALPTGILARPPSYSKL
jgi:hypothetical protein